MQIPSAFVPQLAASIAVLLAGIGLLAREGFAQDSLLGSWAGPWDYTAQLGGTTGCPYDEFSHAALIPRGMHAGKILLWKGGGVQRQTRLRSGCSIRPIRPR